MENPKIITSGVDGRRKLFSGIEKLSTAVKSTLGPRGNTVIIESPNHTRGLTVTKDGVTVAKSISLLDPIENIAVRMMKEAADRTASQAGDGTTTAILMTESIIEKGMEELRALPHMNSTDFSRCIVDISETVIKGLEKMAKKVNGKTLKQVAVISSNNDKDLGGMIAHAYNTVGDKGVVTVEKSQTSSTYFEHTNGIKVKRGYSSNAFVNDHRRDECIMEDVLVLVTDQEINNIVSIERVLKPIVQQNKKLLIIGECSQNMINTLAANVVKNGLKFCNIPPPNFGYRKSELMNDIALSVGAKYFSESTGDNLEMIELDDLGHVDKMIVSKDESVLIGSSKGSKDDIEARIIELYHQMDSTPSDGDKSFILERIAGLNGSIGVIYVGGDSDIEQKEKYDRVDDAVCAVRSALEEGILPGGGSALFQSSLNLGVCEHSDSEEMRSAVDVMRACLCSPIYQLTSHLPVEEFSELIEKMSSNKGVGLDIKTGKTGNMFKMGVIDPLKVTKNALRNAVSVATTILNTNAIVTVQREGE